MSGLTERSAGRVSLPAMLQDVRVAAGRLVVVHDDGDPGQPVDRLVDVAVRELGLGVAAGPVRHHCPACGSSDHGRPSLAGPASGPTLHLSIARCPGRLVVALTDTGPIGVDVERSGVAGRDEVDAVLVGLPGDADGSVEPTRRWVRAEAVLKATGWGLPGAGGPTPSAAAWTSSLDLGPGYDAALAVLTSQRPGVRVIGAGPGGPSG